MFRSDLMFHGNHRDGRVLPGLRAVRGIRTAFGGQTVALKVTEMTAREVV